MGGTHEQHLQYFKKRDEQLKKCPAGTYAVVLRSPGIMHGSFSDDPFLGAGAHPQQTEAASHNFDLITAFVRAFLDRTLKQDRTTLLDTHHPELAEAEIVPYGK